MRHRACPQQNVLAPNPFSKNSLVDTNQRSKSQQPCFCSSFGPVTEDPSRKDISALLPSSISFHSLDVSSGPRQPTILQSLSLVPAIFVFHFHSFHLEQDLHAHKSWGACPASWFHLTIFNSGTRREKKC